MNTAAVCSANGYDISTIFISENDLREQPKKSDIEETKALFRDFCINIPIPEFENLLTLYRWRREILNGDYIEAKPAIKTHNKKNPTGRPRKITIEDFKPHYERYTRNLATRQQIANELKIGLNTFHLLARELVQGAR